MNYHGNKGSNTPEIPSCNPLVIVEIDNTNNSRFVFKNSIKSQLTQPKIDKIMVCS